MEEEKEVKLYDWPEGYEKAKALIDFLETEEEKDAFMAALITTLSQM